VDDGDSGDFRLAVDLLKIHAEGVEKAKVIRPHGRPARVRVSETRHAEMVLQLFLQGEVGEPLRIFQGKETGFFLNLRSATL